jgi:hypothetical protein
MYQIICWEKWQTIQQHCLMKHHLGLVCFVNLSRTDCLNRTWFNLQPHNESIIFALKATLKWVCQSENTFGKAIHFIISWSKTIIVACDYIRRISKKQMGHSNTSFQWCWAGGS